jgi:glycogen operon protein
VEVDGVAWDPEQGGWHVGLWSRHATHAEVIVCHRHNPAVPVLAQPMTRTHEHFVTWLPAERVGDADLYGFVVDGPWQPERGHRFDRHKVLLDPYATQVWFPPEHSRRLARLHGAQNLGQAPLAVLPSPEPHPVPRPLATRPAPHERVILEVHVRHATMALPGVPEAERGTLRGLIHRLDDWAELGVTTVELMPLHQQDPHEGSQWGYMPLAFGAVHHGYGTDPHGDAAHDLVAFVDAAHQRGLEVMVDVVVNHTTEEGDDGPTYSLRGVDQRWYYVVDGDGRLRDDAGCGNVVRAGRPEVGRLLRWTLDRFADLGVDGFRLDLGSLLGRDEHGQVQHRSPLLDDFVDLCHERGLLLVTEPWDLSAYQLGDAFPQPRIAQWNDRFRDDLRGWLRGEPGLVTPVMRRLSGSREIFGHEPAVGGVHRSINFVTAHDGFTMYDLVAYDHKRNEANGHANTDGAHDNRSWGCGWDGDDGVPPEVMTLRARQMRNAMVLLLWSNGTPMLVAGDETARTQQGNNNPYNQDGPLVWHDAERAAQWSDLRRFVQQLLAWRRGVPALGRLEGWGEDVSWHGVHGHLDDGHESRAVAWWLRSRSHDQTMVSDLYVMANTWWEPLDFVIPPGARWLRVLDTSLASPHDLVEPGAGEPVEGNRMRVGPRTTVALARYAVR